MDVYKWAVKLGPLVPGSVLLDAFELARDIRTLDMQASPYDLTDWGYAPVAIETPEGKAEYVVRQRALSERGQAFDGRSSTPQPKRATRPTAPISCLRDLCCKLMELPQTGRKTKNGPVAQLVAHLHGMQGVRGSSPLRSTTRESLRFGGGFVFSGDGLSRWAELTASSAPHNLGDSHNLSPKARDATDSARIAEVTPCAGHAASRDNRLTGHAHGEGRLPSTEKAPPSWRCQRDDTVSRDFASCVSRMTSSSSSQLGALLRRAKM